ncbi:MAG: DUF177 domain-containing protein [Deltaproteobacteria bacterium]|nr:DUF177 domain-containing protein [Deltaproteobacteria bacterium]
MKIMIFDIPEEGLDFAEEVSPGVSFKAHMDKTFENVNLTGQIDIESDPVCHRCVEPFHWQISIPLNINLAPYQEPEFSSEEEESELDQDDLNFSFYRNEEIDLSSIVHEQILLETPIQYLCKEDCKGLCPQCGQNLNQSTCSCLPKQRPSPFSALKKIVKS